MRTKNYFLRFGFIKYRIAMIRMNVNRTSEGLHTTTFEQLVNAEANMNKMGSFMFYFKITKGSRLRTFLSYFFLDFLTFVYVISLPCAAISSSRLAFLAALTASIVVCCFFVRFI